MGSLNSYDIGPISRSLHALIKYFKVFIAGSYATLSKVKGGISKEEKHPA